MSWSSKISSIMEEDDIDIPTIKQGNPKDNQVPTFQDTLNNYDQLLFNREGSLKPDRYSLIDEVKEGDIGGELNQNIDQFFRNKWEGLGPENQDLILQGIDTIQKGKELTKSNWKKYPIESSLWHAIDFIGAVAGPIYQAGTTVTANVGERAFGINRELIEKANTINQIRTGKVFPFLPNRVPGVNLRPKDIGISSRIEKITPLTSGKQMWNITDEINDLMSQPPSYLRKVKNYYGHHEGVSLKEVVRMAKLMDFTTGSLRKNSLFKKGKKNIMYSTGVEPVIDWTTYGYKKDQLPTQVGKAENPELVSKSLNEFYSKVNRIVGSIEGSQGITSGRAKEVVKQIPTWWTHPETGKLYRSAWNNKEKRLTIKPISRNLLENQQSSVIQKRNYRKYKKEITSMNKTLDKELETTQLELDKLDEDLPAVMRHAGSMGKDGSSKSSVMNSFFAKRNELVKKIEDLANGKYYTEHGYYLLSEKIRNKVVDSTGFTSINESKEFQLGNLNNQYVTKNVDKFSEFKTRIETAIDSLNDGYYNYPDLVVGYNPKLEGKEYTIRIENLNSLKVGKDVKGVLSGDAILKIDFNDKKLVKKLSSIEGIKKWLSENGIEASSKELSRKPEKISVRQDRKPTETKTETKNRIMSLVEQVFDMRISIENYLKSIGRTAGDSPVKKGRPLGATDLKQRKIKNPDQQDLDL
tara:strand:- start:39 stop:2123 length:2085 start_codon:yes stop_codon:yes gene_type:complete